MRHSTDAESLPWGEMQDFLVEISAAENLDAFIKTLFNRIGNLIPFDHSAQLFRATNNEGMPFYNAFLSGNPSFVCMEDSTGNRTLVENFNSYYWRLQPPPEGIQTNAYIIDWKTWDNTEYYCDFISPEGIRHSLVPVKRKMNYILTLQRGVGTRGFRDNEKNTLQILAPQIDTIYSCLRKIEVHWKRILSCIELEPLSCRLTKREAEIIKLILFHLTAEEISAVLCISRRTVEKHISDVYEKMNVHSRWELFSEKKMHIYSQDSEIKPSLSDK